MNELIFSDARLQFISSLDKKSRIVIMAYENYCNSLKKMSKLQELNHFSLNKSLILTLESILSFLDENEVQVNRSNKKYSTISENTNVFSGSPNSSSSSNSSEDSIFDDSSSSLRSSSSSYSSEEYEEEKPDIEDAHSIL